eukprot:1161212-Pelagomonas_calceolata.AAC.11
MELPYPTSAILQNGLLFFRFGALLPQMKVWRQTRSLAYPLPSCALMKSCSQFSHKSSVRPSPKRNAGRCRAIDGCQFTCSASFSFKPWHQRATAPQGIVLCCPARLI